MNKGMKSPEQMLHVGNIPANFPAVQQANYCDLHEIQSIIVRTLFDKVAGHEGRVAIFNLLSHIHHLPSAEC